MIKRILSILAALTVWAAVTLYFVKTTRLSGNMTDTTRIQRLKIIVADSASIGILNASALRSRIDSAGLNPEGMPLEAVPTARISELTASHDFVRDVDVWTDLTGTLTVRITQHAPLFRVASGSGDDLYITSDGFLLPARPGSAQYVPVVTGEVPLPAQTESEADNTEKNRFEGGDLLSKLITFVSYIANDSFWNAMIVQIDVRRERERLELTLVPRAGNCVILLGETDGFRERLERLRAFYRTRTCRESLGRWRSIDLRYDNQIVCTN